MSLVLAEQGCHTWVVTAGAVGPILSVDGHRLEDHAHSDGGAAARTPSDASASTDEPPVPDALATVGVAATSGHADPTITACACACALPGAPFGVLELGRIGPLHLIVPGTEPRAWADTHFTGATLAHRARNRRVQVIAAAMATDPGRSIPGLFTRWYDVRAA